MKVLLSAYACEPNRGSEPAVGWNWAIELAKLGHDVRVLTRCNNQPGIEDELAKMRPIPNLRFIYHDCPRWLLWLKRKTGATQLYYFFWQIGAYWLAKRLHAAEKFDIVHHVTFVSARQPSLMGLLGIPFIFGPVAGGERAPVALRKGYPLKGKIADGLRDVINWCVRLDPLMHLTFQTAERIYVTSEQTREMIPARYHPKTKIKLAIGISLDTIRPADALPPSSSSVRQLLYVGRLVYLKRLDIALKAFAIYRARHPHSRFTIVGEGPEMERLQNLVRQLGLESSIDWQPWMSQDRLQSLYQSHDVLLFPSLRDSGGLVVLEAMACGMPVICFELGGPGVMVDSSCGRGISTAGLTETSTVQMMATQIEVLMSRDNHFKSREGALERVKQFTWTGLAKAIYSSDLPDTCQADTLSQFPQTEELTGMSFRQGD